MENGVVKDTKMLSSASEPVAIRTKVENREMKADGADLSFVQIEIVDREGRVCPNASVELEAIVTGPGEMAEQLSPLDNHHWLLQYNHQHHG